jgi:cellulose synthase/poly-beta-1,6-N-acetylglucosamine synthase-like glycosyltransferase
MQDSKNSSAMAELDYMLKENPLPRTTPFKDLVHFANRLGTALRLLSMQMAQNASINGENLSDIPPGNNEHGGCQIVGELSVIFPALNEEANIRRTVEAARGILPKIAARWEIIVVNDGSTDATARICDELKEKYSEVKIVHHERNRGYGAALKSGIMSASYDLVFFSDSDGQFNFDDLQQLICWAEDYDIVAGYRAKRHDPLYRRINALGWNVLVRLVLGIKIRDIDCAFKLFRRSVFDHVQIRCVGAMVNTEILAQATQLGMRIHQVKVNHLPRRYGKQSGANIHVVIKAFGELCRLWRKLRHVEVDQAGLYSVTDDAPTTPVSPDGASEPSSYWPSFGVGGDKGPFTDWPV